MNYESKVKSRVRSGEFANASECVRHCIRVAEAGEAAVQGSGKTEFLFRLGPLHKRFGGLALTCHAAKRRSNSTVKLGAAILFSEPPGPWSARSANC